MKAEEGRFLVSRRNLDSPSVPKKQVPRLESALFGAFSLGMTN
jgi:hypothetical protein